MVLKSVFAVLTTIFVATESYGGVSVIPCGTLSPDIPYASAVAYDGKHSVYFFGGYTSYYRCDSIYKVDLADVGSAELVASLPYPRRDGVVVATEDYSDFYYIGGYDNTYAMDNSMSIFKYAQGQPTAERVVNLTIWREGHSAAKFGDGIFIFGGDICKDFYSPERCSRSTVELYNITTNTVEIVATFEYEMFHGASAAVDGDFIYLFGGYSWTFFPYFLSNQVLRFNPLTYAIDVMDEKLFANTTRTNTVIVDSLAYVIPSYYMSYSDIMTYQVGNGGVSKEVDIKYFDSERPFSTAYAVNQNLIYIFGANQIYKDHNVMCIKVPNSQKNMSNNL